MFCCSDVEPVCDLGARVIQLKDFSFHGRSDVVRCIAAGELEQFRQRP